MTSLLLTTVVDVLAILITVSRLTAELTAISGLQCYICESTSFVSYSDAEAECNTGSLRSCPDTKHSACMIEAFKRDGPVYHVIKKCRNDCPVLINSTAQHIRCCFKDACNDVITIASTSNDISRDLEAKQPVRASLPVAEQSSTETTSTTSWTSETSDDQSDDDDKLIANTFRRSEDVPFDDHPLPALEPGSATPPRSTTTESSTTPTRRRWHPRRGRYPPSQRNRYGRRPHYRSTGHRAIGTVFLLTFQALLTTGLSITRIPVL